MFSIEKIENKNISDKYKDRVLNSNLPLAFPVK